MQRKMLLENQLWSYQMQKGEQIDLYLLILHEIRDQLTSIAATPDQEFMMTTTLKQSPRSGRHLSKAFWAELLFQDGKRYGQLFPKKRSDG